MPTFNIESINSSKGNRIDISKFTSDQSVAYTKLMEFINSPFDKNNFKRALIGAAGTGKTYSVKALINNCNISFSEIGLAAPTHKACRVLRESIGLKHANVNTIQSDLGLRVNFDVEKFDINNPPFDPKGKIKIDSYKLYIVDEASMINRGLKTFLERMAVKHEVKIIYIGDESQLPPVNEKYSSALRGIETLRLTQIVRQGEDNPISPLLEMLRYDIKNKKFTFLEHITRNRSHYDINHIKGYSVCTPAEFNAIVQREFTYEAFVTNVDLSKVIGYTNNCVNGWNNFIRNSIILDAEKSVITKNDLIISYITIVNEFNEIIIRNSEEYILKDVVNYIHPKYNLKGFMVRFTAIHGGETTTPLFIVDHRDAFSIQMYYKIANELIHTAQTATAARRAAAWKEYFAFKESSLLLVNIVNGNGQTVFSRDLDYGFSVTSHKSQGSTFDTALVDVNDIVYDKYHNPYNDAEDINRRLYVACSRAKNKLYLKYGL